MRRVLVAALAVGMFAAPAAAQLSADFAAWADGPVMYVLTEEESRQYALLKSDEAARRFVDLFWVQRDPDLTTRANEFKLDFDAKVLAADEQFVEEDGRGAMTDRGRVLVLLGVPAKRWKEGIGNLLSKMYGQDVYGQDRAVSALDAQSRMHGIAFDHNRGLADVWVYSREQIPEAIEIPSRVESVMFAFFDPEGRDHFALERGIREAKWGAKVLVEAPALFRVHPELTEMPIFPLIPGTLAATAEQLAWLIADPAPWPEVAELIVARSVGMEHENPFWILLQMPADLAAADLMVGELVRGDGTVEGSFQQPVQRIEALHGSLYELALPASAGTSTLRLGLAAQGTPVAVVSRELVVEEIALDQTVITEMLAGAELEQLQAFEPGTPFVYGGYHLLPRADHRYEFDENLDYFCLVVRPGLKEDGQPNTKMKLKLYLGDQQVSSQPYRSVELSEMAPNVYMFGSQLPLSILPEGGDYRLEVTLKDFVSGVERKTEIPIIMPEKRE